jgi:hypothetical protein
MTIGSSPVEDMQTIRKGVQSVHNKISHAMISYNSNKILTWRTKEKIRPVA